MFSTYLISVEALQHTEGNVYLLILSCIVDEAISLLVDNSTSFVDGRSFVSLQT